MLTGKIKDGKNAMEDWIDVDEDISRYDSPALPRYESPLPKSKQERRSGGLLKIQVSKQTNSSIQQMDFLMP